MLKEYGVDSVLPIAKPKGAGDTTSGDTTDVGGEESGNGKPNGQTPPGRIQFTDLRG
jgi:hypothetical protein